MLQYLPVYPLWKTSNLNVGSSSFSARTSNIKGLQHFLKFILPLSFHSCSTTKTTKSLQGVAYKGNHYQPKELSWINNCPSKTNVHKRSATSSLVITTTNSSQSDNQKFRENIWPVWKTSLEAIKWYMLFHNETIFKGIMN